MSALVCGRCDHAVAGPCDRADCEVRPARVVLDDGGQAFPAADPGMNGTYGMTLRDWFAGQALAGVVERCAADTLMPGEDIEHLFARRAYQVADAMLAARARRRA